MTTEPAPLDSREKPPLVAWRLGRWVAIFGTSIAAAALAWRVAG